MKKNLFLVSVLAVFVLFPAAVWAVGGKEKPVEVERPLKGVEVNVGLLARSLSDALKPYLADFEAETGIKVNIEQHAYDSLRDKMMLEL